MSFKYEPTYHYEYESKEWGDFKIVKQLSLRGKTKVPYYLIRFKETSNENEVPEHTIDRREVVDIVQQKKETKKRKRDKKAKEKAKKKQERFKGKIKLKSSDKIISVDGSSKVTAWTIWKNKKPINYDYVHISSSDEYSATRRCYKMILKLQNVIEKEDIKAVFFENIIFKHKKVLYVLSMLQGMKIKFLLDEDIDFRRVDVKSWKATISKQGWKNGFSGTNRQQSKLATLKRVREIYGIDLINDDYSKKDKKKKVYEDLADSIGIGHHAIKKMIEWED